MAPSAAPTRHSSIGVGWQIGTPGPQRRINFNCPLKGGDHVQRRSTEAEEQHQRLGAADQGRDESKERVEGATPLRNARYLLPCHRELGEGVGGGECGDETGLAKAKHTERGGVHLRHSPRSVAPQHLRVHPTLLPKQCDLQAERDNRVRLGHVPTQPGRVQTIPPCEVGFAREQTTDEAAKERESHQVPRAVGEFDIADRRQCHGAVRVVEHRHARQRARAVIAVWRRAIHPPRGPHSRATLCRAVMQVLLHRHVDQARDDAAVDGIQDQCR